MDIEYSKSHIVRWIEKIKKGEMKPDQLVAGNYSDITMLQAVVMTKMSPQMKHKLCKQLISLGCNVDQFASGSTAISNAVISNANEDDFKNIVMLMLQHHEKGHMSDYNILKSCLLSFDDEMFEFIVKSGKIDTNVTRNRGTHILHALAEDQFSANHIYSIFTNAPETIPNPINKKGLSPLAIAINKTNSDGAIALWKNTETKIMGKLEKPEIVIAYDMVDRYHGNFFKDYPEMIEYAIKTNKTKMLPSEIDIFLF